MRDSLLQRKKYEVKQISLLTILFFVCLFSFAQNTAKITGKVTGENNKPISGASISIIGKKGGTTANVDGVFTLTLEVGKKYEIEISAVGFGTKRVNEIEVKSGQQNDVYVVLEAKAGKLDDLVIKTTSSKKETVNALISYQTNTNTVAQVISAESNTRSPDKTKGEIWRRVTGTSGQDGKYIVVRGLADRYNQGRLNGIFLSMTELERKKFQLELL